MSQGSNVLGLVQDIRPVAEYLHENDIFFIVDGAQTAGTNTNRSHRYSGRCIRFHRAQGTLWHPRYWRILYPGPRSNRDHPPGGTGTDSMSLTIRPICRHGSRRGRTITRESHRSMQGSGLSHQPDLMRSGRKNNTSYTSVHQGA